MRDIFVDATQTKICPDLADLLKSIEAFLERSGMGVSYFGKKFVETLS